MDLTLWLLQPGARTLVGGLCVSLEDPPAKVEQAVVDLCEHFGRLRRGTLVIARIDRLGVAGTRCFQSWNRPRLIYARIAKMVTGVQEIGREELQKEDQRDRRRMGGLRLRDGRVASG